MKRSNSAAQLPSYKKDGKIKTVKSPKRAKPSYPTDYNTVSVRKINHDVKIKKELIDRVDIIKGSTQEFNNRVDTTKGLAPIFGSMNGKSTDRSEQKGKT